MRRAEADFAAARKTIGPRPIVRRFEKVNAAADLA
jgi:hypothetical protein